MTYASMWVGVQKKTVRLEMTYASLWVGVQRGKDGELTVVSSENASENACLHDCREFLTMSMSTR